MICYIKGTAVIDMIDISNDIFITTFNTIQIIGTKSILSSKGSPLELQNLINQLKKNLSLDPAELLRIEIIKKS